MPGAQLIRLVRGGAWLDRPAGGTPHPGNAKAFRDFLLRGEAAFGLMAGASVPIVQQVVGPKHCVPLALTLQTRPLCLGTQRARRDTPTFLLRFLCVWPCLISFAAPSQK